MIAKFYIVPESLSDENLSNDDFLISLENFISDYHNLIEYKDENKIYIQANVYDVELPNGRTLGEFIYSQDLDSKGKDRSLKQFLSSVFQKLPTVDISINDIKENIKHNSIDSCVGIISLIKVEEIADENQIIYDKNSWFGFRRYHLALFYGDADYFINECKKYFPDLFFHDNNYLSIGKILTGFSLKIIRHLEGLHDKLPNLLAKKEYSNHTDLLVKFSNEAGLDENATLEGGNKTRLKFEFINSDKEIEELVCEPHMKLCKNDSDDGVYYYYRIYFHFGKENIQDSKILVAHIGDHL
jgi:hypothetical protein